MFCRKDYIHDIGNIERLIWDLPDLTDRDKVLVQLRFKRIGNYVNKHFRKISRYYNWTKVFVICAGVVNPAILSIQKADSSEYLFWIVWGLQLAVSLTTAIQSFFKWDKKYYLFHSYRTKIIQEMWLFLELTGPYADDNATHKEKLNDFLLRIEVIYRKLKDSSLEIESQTEEERKGKVNKKTEEEQSGSEQGDMRQFKFRSERKEISPIPKPQSFQINQLKQTFNQILPLIANLDKNRQIHFEKIKKFETNKLSLTSIERNELNDNQFKYENIESELEGLEEELVNTVNRLFIPVGELPEKVILMITKMIQKYEISLELKNNLLTRLRCQVNEV